MSRSFMKIAIYFKNDLQNHNVGYSNFSDFNVSPLSFNEFGFCVNRMYALLTASRVTRPSAFVSEGLANSSVLAGGFSAIDSRASSGTTG